MRCCSWLTATLALLVSLALPVIGCAGEASLVADGRASEAGAGDGGLSFRETGAATPADRGAPSCADGLTPCGDRCLAGVESFTFDPDNCGRCGHSCLGGACVGGRCQPVTLATSQQGCFTVAVDDARVYWPAEAQVRACAKTGCPGGGPEVVAAGLGQAYAVSTTPGALFFTDATAGAIYKCPASGCGDKPEPFSAGHEGAWSLVSDGTLVLWAGSGGQVASCPVAGCAPAARVLASNQGSPRGAVMDATHFYWSNSSAGAIVRCPRPDCAGGPEELARDGEARPFSLALTSTHVYWSDRKLNHVARCPLAGCGGEDPELVAEGQRRPQDLVVAGAGLYWVAGDDGAIRHCPLSGCGTGGPMTLHDEGGSGLRGLAADAQALYFTNTKTGRVAKVAR